MKKTYFITIFLGLILLGSKTVQTAAQPDAPNKTPAFISDSFVGSMYKGNFIWGGAMNLAWNDLTENILHEKLILNTANSEALNIAKHFNTSRISKTILDPESYYIKSGYGQKTVNTINTETRQKFPQKSFGNLSLFLRSTDIIAYAYFLKDMKYAEEFTKDTLQFNGKTVTAFYAETKKQRKTVNIVTYKNDEQFIVSLKLKTNGDDFFLAKGYNMKNLQEALKTINKTAAAAYDTMTEDDFFSAPNIHINYQRNYDEIIGKALANDHFQGYIIGEMFENIRFDMDQKGARAENEAVITMLATSGPPNPQAKPRYLVFDKPFLIIMKRTTSEIPYFILGVNNSAIMELQK